MEEWESVSISSHVSIHGGGWEHGICFWRVCTRTFWGWETVLLARQDPYHQQSWWVVSWSQILFMYFILQLVIVAFYFWCNFESLIISPTRLSHMAREHWQWWGSCVARWGMRCFVGVADILDWRLWSHKNDIAEWCVCAERQHLFVAPAFWQGKKNWFDICAVVDETPGFFAVCIIVFWNYFSFWSCGLNWFWWMLDWNPSSPRPWVRGFGRQDLCVWRQNCQRLHWRFVGNQLWWGFIRWDCKYSRENQMNLDYSGRILCWWRGLREYITQQPRPSPRSRFQETATFWHGNFNFYEFSPKTNFIRCGWNLKRHLFVLICLRLWLLQIFVHYLCQCQRDCSVWWIGHEWLGEHWCCNQPW